MRETASSFGSGGDSAVAAEQPDLQEQIQRFKEKFLEAMPDGKEIKSQKKVVEKSYSRFLKMVNKLEWLDEYEEASGVPRVYLVWLGVLCIGLITLMSFFVKETGMFMTNTLAFVYPTYASIKALISEDKRDDTQWLTYWFVYGFFSLFEQVFLVQSVALPMYFSAKLLFLFWCQFAKGADLLHMLFIKPFFMALSVFSS